MTEIKTVEQYVVDKRLRPRLERIAADLGDVAKQIQQAAEGLTVESVGANSSYTFVAGRVSQSIMNMLPNLGLEALAGYAAEADVARAKGD